MASPAGPAAATAQGLSSPLCAQVAATAQGLSSLLCAQVAGDAQGLSSPTLCPGGGHRSGQ